MWEEVYLVHDSLRIPWKAVLGNHDYMRKGDPEAQLDFTSHHLNPGKLYLMAPLSLLYCLFSVSICMCFSLSLCLSLYIYMYISSLSHTVFACLALFISTDGIWQMPGHCYQFSHHHSTAAATSREEENKTDFNVDFFRT